MGDYDLCVIGASCDGMAEEILELYTSTGMRKINACTHWVKADSNTYIEVFPSLYRFGRKRFQDKGLHISKIDADTFNQYWCNCNAAWSENKECLSPCFKEYFINTFSGYMDRNFSGIDWRNNDAFIIKIMNVFYK